MFSIRVRERGKVGVLVELRGEFDQHNLQDLRETLSGVVALRLPTMVDLAGVTFLDITASRELAIHSWLYAHHLILSDPSWQARASMAACGSEEWLVDRRRPETGAQHKAKISFDHIRRCLAES